MNWFVYMVKCSDNSLYSGTTTDVARRVREHNTSKRGAKYTRAHRPVREVYRLQCKDRSEACVLESTLKGLTRTEKILVMLGKVHLRTVAEEVGALTPETSLVRGRNQGPNAPNEGSP